MYLVCTDYKRFPENGQLIASAKMLGMRVEPVVHDIDESFFIYGTRQFVLPRVDNPNHIYQGQEYVYDYSFVYSSSLRRYLFNAHSYFVPAGNTAEFLSDSEEFGGGDVFCRANSGNKQVAGQVLSRRMLEENISSIFRVNPWEMIVLAKAQTPPKEEYRFFFFRTYNDRDNECIKSVYCRYLPEPSLEVDKQIVYFAQNIAEKIFNEMPFGNSFVLDVFVDEYGKRTIGELNSVNSSSFYCISTASLLELIFKL